MRASYNAARTGKVPRPAVARGASIPAPIGGWDAISPLANMKPDRAVQLDNWFPQTGWVELRKGFVLHCNTNTQAAVETLAAYQGVGIDALFAVADNTIFDVTGDTETSAVSGLQNSRFQHAMFATTGGNFLYMVNGADDPQFFDGTSWDVPVITGLDATGFVTVTPHKSRLWFAQNNSSDAAYLDTDSIQGPATAFPVGGNWSMGGYLMQIASWSLDAGDGPDDYIAFLSSRGQVSVYKGIDPDTDFALVGTYLMGPPIGRRCITKVGADVAVICLDGVVPLSKALIYERAAVQQVTLTENILRVMNQSARDYKDNFGWQLISYPRGTRAILNVPVAENFTQHQYVMNTLSGAWCRFLGMNGSCWETYQDRLFFGGNDGKVYEADKSGSDFNQKLTADFMTAFNYYGKRGNQKRWMNCRPQLTTDQQVTPGIAFNTDFQTNAALSTTAVVARPESLWDTALWDIALWPGDVVTQSLWTSVTGLGYCASIRMKVDIINPVNSPGEWGVGFWGAARWAGPNGAEIVLRVNAFDLTLEDGAQI